MIIERLEMDSFGKMKARTVEFSPGINLVIGDNESGKTTMRHALETLVHGFGKKPGVHPYRPWTGEPVRIFGVMRLENGDVLEIRRGLGKSVEGDLFDGERHRSIGNAPLDFVSHLTPDLHRQLYSLTTEESSSMAELDMTMVERRLLATFGADEIRPTEEVLEQLKTNGDRLYRLNGRGNSEIKELKERITVWNGRLHEAREKRRSFEEMHRSLHRTQDALSEEKKRMRELDSALDEITDALDILKGQDWLHSDEHVGAEDMGTVMEQIDFERKRWESITEEVARFDSEEERLKGQYEVFNRMKTVLGSSMMTFDIRSNPDSMMLPIQACITGLRRLQDLNRNMTDFPQTMRLSHGIGVVAVISSASMLALLRIVPVIWSIIAMTLATGSFIFAEVIKTSKRKRMVDAKSRELGEICISLGFERMPTSDEVDALMACATGLKAAVESHVQRYSQILHMFEELGTKTGLIPEFWKVTASQKVETLRRRYYDLERRHGLLQDSLEKKKRFKEKWGHSADESVRFWCGQAGCKPEDKDILSILGHFSSGLLETVSSKRESIQALAVEAGAISKEIELAELPDLAALEEEAMRDTDLLRSKIEARDRITILEWFIRKQDQRFREMKQPEVLKRASGYLAGITDGRYRRLAMNQDEKLTVWGEMGNATVDEVTSTGLREQIHFALKVALMDAIEKDHESLPLVVDELFANWDDRRGRHMATLLLEVAQKRQIILLSCNERINALFENVMVEKGLNSNVCSIIMEA